MGNMSAVETLQAIRAGFAALQAELEEARAELALLRADKVDLSAVMAQNAEVDSLRARVAELEAAASQLLGCVKTLLYIEGNDPSVETIELTDEAVIYMETILQKTEAANV